MGEHTMGKHHRIGSKCTLDNCGEAHDAAELEPNRSTGTPGPLDGLDLARELGCLEVRDLGLQLYNGSEHHLVGYVTAMYWRCDACQRVTETLSVLEYRFVLETKLGPLNTPPFRLGQDRSAVEISKAKHVCLEADVRDALRLGRLGQIRVVEAERPD